MNFKEWLIKENTEDKSNLSNLEIASMYFNKNETIRSLAKNTNKSVSEIYKIVHSYGKPNRVNKRYDTVVNLSSSGMNPKSIADFTGYSPRHVYNIIKK